MILKKTVICLSFFTISGLLLETACSSMNGHFSIENSFSFFSKNTKTENQNKISNQVEQTRAKIVYGSLWDSDLFAQERFLLNIKLTEKEKVLAKQLAKSFESHMKDSTLIMHFLLTELKERNLPIELAALPLVESGFDPRAKSRAGAKGPWQFMRKTGNHLGLETTSNYDEFYDFIDSTKASLTFLEHLYNELNQNWDLAIAAYNQGEFAVKKAIRRAKKAGVKDINLNTVKLSRYAYVYVSKFRCYSDILKNPQNYRVKRPTIEDRVAFKSVSIAGRINSMEQAAKLSGVDVKLLKHLNAGFLSDSLVTSKNKELLIPVDHVDQFEKALNSQTKINKTTL